MESLYPQFINNVKENLSLMSEFIIPFNDTEAITV